MYHIKNDKRQQATADRLVEGLKQCLYVKNMSEISVSDLSTAAGVSRSSFYRSFDTPVDVLHYACDEMAAMLVRDYRAAKVDISDKDGFILFTLRYWSERQDILEAIVNCDRQDIIYKAIERHAEELLVGNFRNLLVEFGPIELEYLKMAAAGMLSNVLLVWIRHGKRETPEQLFALYCKLRKLQ